MPEENNSTDISFQSLTAKTDININNVTKGALNFALNPKSDITNVAITGNYGAGKSSVIESYELICENKKFIHISLGQYDETISSGKNGLNNHQINTIEGKIINQLLHQINPNKIRKSIFKTLDAESQIKPWPNTFFLGTLIILLMYFFNLNSWTELVKNISWINWTVSIYAKLLAIFILFSLIIYSIFYLLKIQKEIGIIRRLTFRLEKVDTDIEIFSNEDPKVSYFDRYLDDVLYLFKNSEADVIIFEDIERFNDSRIFEKLKELNVIINRKRKICDDTKLLFLYLVKDDLFESQERTKFFDYIIPIIPVVTASNSYDQLSKLLHDMNLHNDLGDDFLFNISLYLDDMRLINNICNEYLMYKETLNILTLNCEKLFSMVVYKNIFPKDFSRLQRNRGFLYELLNSKERQLKNQREILYREIQVLEKQLNSVRSEHLSNEVELYGTIYRIPSGKSLVSVNGKLQSDFTSYSSFIKELIKEDSEILSYSNFSDFEYKQHHTRETKRSVFPDYDSFEFQERMRGIKSKNEENSLLEKKDRLIDEFELLEGYRLSDIYQSADQIDSFESTFIEEIKQNPQYSVINFLIRNSYIDETYQDYLNHFYENTISKDEKEYIINILSGRENNPEILLTHINEIINRLDIKNYKFHYVLNYSLFKYLLLSINDSNNYERLKYIFNQNNILIFLINFFGFAIHEKNIEEIDIYEYEKIMEAFFDHWLKFNSKLFNEYFSNENNDDSINQQRRDMFLLFLNLSDINSLSENTKNIINNFADTNFDIFTGTYNNQHPDRLKNNLKKLKIQFTNFSTHGNKEDRSQEQEVVSFIDFIFENNLYIINENNLRFFMYWYIKNTDDDFKHKNFEIINREIQLKPLLKYISSTDVLLKYISVYLTFSTDEICDDSQYIEYLLNNNDLFEHINLDESEGEKNYESKNIIEEIIYRIPELSIVYTNSKFKRLSDDNEKKLVKLLVENYKSAVNSQIIVKYFSIYEEINQFVINLINKDLTLKFDSNDFDLLPENRIENFMDEIVTSDQLELIIYKNILQDIGWCYSSFILEGISDERFKFLIDIGMIKFNVENLEFIEEVYPNFKNEFIIKNIDDYLNVVEERYDTNELISLLQMDRLNDSYKMKLIDNLEVVSLKNGNLSEELINYILDYKFDINDLDLMVNPDYFDKSGKSIQEKIYKLVISNIDNLITLNKINISINLCYQVLKDDDVKLSTKISFLKYLLKTPTMEEYKMELLSKNIDLLELPYIMSIFSEELYFEWESTFDTLNDNSKGNKFALVENSTFNRIMTNYLQNRHLISSHSVQLEGIRLNGFKGKQIEY